MKNSKFLGFLIFIFLFSSFYLFSMGPEEMGTGKRKNSHMMQGKKSDPLLFIDELNLSSEQIKKLQDLKDKSKREFLKLSYENSLARLDLHDEYKKKNPDKDKIFKIIDKIADIQKQKMKLHAENMLEIKKILSEDQFNKLMIFMESKKKKFKRKMFKK